MLRIEFNSFDKELGKISLTIKTYENGNLIKNDNVYFRLDKEIFISDNNIAIALSTFCRRGYDEIYFDLNLTKDIVNLIASFSNANVIAKNILSEEPKQDSESSGKIGLNFSGGFDSLAAKIILGEYAELISVSFFESEYNFFKKFKPHTLETNFRQLGYADNDWTFMGVGSILFSDYLNLKYHLFGTVLEAFHMHAYKDFASRQKFIEEPFNLAGLTDIKLIQGLTEIGTALVVCNVEPYLINDSIISLAPQGTEKRYRKQLIVQSLIKKFNLNIYLEQTVPPIESERRNWGEYFAVDFLALYILKYMGYEEVSKIVNNVPSDVIEFVKNHSLTFYERFNTNFLNNIPSEFKSEILKNLATAKILPYTQEDFEELYEVMVYLSNYHNYLKEIL